MGILSNKQKVLQKAILMVKDLSPVLDLLTPEAPDVALDDYTEEHQLDVIRSQTLMLRRFHNLIEGKGECHDCKKLHRLAAKQEFKQLVKAQHKQACLIAGIGNDELIADCYEERRKTGKKKYTGRTTVRSSRSGTKIMKSVDDSPLLSNVATNGGHLSG